MVEVGSLCTHFFPPYLFVCLLVRFFIYFSFSVEIIAAPQKLDQDFGMRTETLCVLLFVFGFLFAP